MNNISIKLKTYILVFLGAATAMVLSFVSTSGLNEIEKQLAGLELAVNVERYAYKTILEEKNYLLNSNGSTSNAKIADAAFEKAKQNVITINKTLDTIDETATDADVLEKSKNARRDANIYKNLYYDSVALLKDLAKDLRLILTRKETTPPIFSLMSLIGKHEIIRRLEYYLK